MPLRSCSNCGERHGPPTGKKCHYHHQMADPSTDEAVNAIKRLENIITKLADRVSSLEVPKHSPPSTQVTATVISPTSTIEAAPVPTPVFAAYTPVPASVTSPAPVPVTPAGTPVPPAPITHDTDATSDIALSLTKAAQARLQQRLAALGLGESDSESDSDGQTNRRKTKKSGKLRTADHSIKCKVDWPHFHVYKGKNYEAANYNELSMAEFTYGYITQVKRANESTKEKMIDHLLCLMQDAMTHPWPAVRTYHSILLNRMEIGEITWADDTLKQELRRQYVWHAITQKSEVEKTTACVPFQRGACEHEDAEHVSSTHFCTYCFRQAGKHCLHAENRCRRKATDSKNGRGE